MPRRRAVDARRIGIEQLGRVGDAGARAHYDDPAYYTKTYTRRDRDVLYYVDLAHQYASSGPVLEYGIGTGRIALPLARTGIEVFGIDLSPSMLSGLRAALQREAPDVRKRIHAVRGDMRSRRLRRRFPLVIAPFNVMLHLYTRKDVERFLARVREHLEPRGRFVFDWSVPHASDLCRDPRRSFGTAPIIHPTFGRRVRYAERFEYDRLRQILLISMRFMPDSGRAWEVPLTHRQFFPAEMDALLHYNGFRVIRRNADFTDEPPDADVDSMVVMARLRTARR